MEKQLTEKLHEFLVRKGVLDKFMANAKNEAMNGALIVPSAIANDISSSFIWCGTKEGQDFWEKLESEFYSAK